MFRPIKTGVGLLFQVRKLRLKKQINRQIASKVAFGGLLFISQVFTGFTWQSLTHSKIKP
jgi:hypothetical protein